MRKYSFYLLCVFFLAPPDCLVAAECWKGTVVKVIDGNTLIANQKNSQIKVRLYGITAPETGQLFAIEAKEFLRELVLDKEVTVCPKKTQGAMAAEVHVLKGFMLNVNREILRKGFARSTVDQYKSHENSARKKGLGLWSKDSSKDPNNSHKKTAAKPILEQREAVPFKTPPNKRSGSLSVYKVQPAPQTEQVSDNNTQAIDPVVVEQRQQELEAIREQERARVSDTTLSLTDIDEFKLSANFMNDWYESYAGLEISFDYWSTSLDSPVDWNDGDVYCECRVTGHFSEGTNTRIARTNVLLSSFRDRVYIDIPYSYLEDAFVELLSCTVECRISAGIFDLKASDKVYLQFTGRPLLYQRTLRY